MTIRQLLAVLAVTPIHEEKRRHDTAGGQAGYFGANTKGGLNEKKNIKTNIHAIVPGHGFGFCASHEPFNRE